MLATDISASNCLTNWVNGVASEDGIFVKSVILTSLEIGISGIPDGWTVYVDCVSPSIINTLNSDVDFKYNNGGTYKPNSYNTNLSEVLKNVDDILSLTPECDLFVDIVYSKDNTTGEIIIENHLWENKKQFKDILNDLNELNELKLNYDQIVIIIVDMIDVFTIKASEDGLTVSLSQNTSYYRIDKGDWTPLSADVTTPSINAGQKIQFKMTDPIISSSSGIGTFTISKPCDIEGNIMSLLHGDYFSDKTDLTGKNYVFSDLFYDCSAIVNAKNLILPATTLARSCYSEMFSGCTSLVTAPELPATTLERSCYSFMFKDCTSLETAPVLPATTLEHSCYSNMFEDCSKLNEIKMLATDISATYCLSKWVSGVSSGGTFIKNFNMTSLPSGISGIPNGWTVNVDYVSPSIIDPSNFDVAFNFSGGMYTPNSDNINLFDYFNADELLSLTPECDLFVDIVYSKDNTTDEIIEKKYLWENSIKLGVILNELKYNINDIVIIIVDVIEPEESGYYYD